MHDRPLVSTPLISTPLISTEELAVLLESAEPPVVLDVRWRLGGPPGIDSYLAGHLPGARFIDLDTELSGPPGADGRHPLPSTAVFEAAMRRAGLNAGRLVVAYDDGDATVAARLWWMLKYYGHRRAAVLDGGYRTWATAGYPVTKATTKPEPGERYRGEVEPVDRVAGHIPGAISAPSRGNVGEDGRFLAKPALAERFASLGLPASADQAMGADGRPVVGAYCGSGVTAAQEVLALELAGLPAALYVGSWSGWSADPGRPIATGADPG
jgi:thiosulfate/3-mercaptopyruvate sulfurtransferase